MPAKNGEFGTAADGRMRFLHLRRPYLLESRALQRVSRSPSTEQCNLGPAPFILGKLTLTREHEFARLLTKEDHAKHPRLRR